MADLGAELGRHPDGKTAAIRLVTIKFTARRASKAKCDRRATILIEGRDRIGHPIWHREFCEDHARPLIERAKQRGIETYWHGDPPADWRQGLNAARTETMSRTAIAVLWVVIAVVVGYSIWHFELVHRPQMDTPRSDYSGTHAP